MTALAHTIDAPVVEDEPEHALKAPGLFQVWIDLNFGKPPADWWWNSPPQPLGDALDEAADARRSGWVCIIEPEGKNPRPDGRWDNP
jgi:hypothetical protein